MMQATVGGDLLVYVAMYMCASGRLPNVSRGWCDSIILGDGAWELLLIMS